MLPLFLHCASACSSRMILRPNLTHIPNMPALSYRELICVLFTTRLHQKSNKACLIYAKSLRCASISTGHEWENQQPARSTHLYCRILRSRHHDTEDWVEDDVGDWTAVATQCVPFWGTWDPLFGVTLLTYGPTQGDLLLGFIQFGFEFHHLSGSCKFRQVMLTA